MLIGRLEQGPTRFFFDAAPEAAGIAAMQTPRPSIKRVVVMRRNTGIMISLRLKPAFKAK
jgi:hypothetical protein